MENDNNNGYTEPGYAQDGSAAGNDGNKVMCGRCSCCVLQLGLDVPQVLMDCTSLPPGPVTLPQVSPGKRLARYTVTASVMVCGGGGGGGGVGTSAFGPA